MFQAPSKLPSTEQYFTHSVITWEEFKTIQTVLAPQGVRMSYLQGEVELLTVSDLHGMISGNLGYLLEMYMLEHLVRFIGLEDFSIEIPAIASAQADKAYCFDERKSIPDLAIEVVITGERETKLKRYAALHVSEVWFWMDDEIRTYQLDENSHEYNRTSQSAWLPDIDLQRLALAVTQEFRADAIKVFGQ
ncbi:MAG: Uma2 family endonuclease [Cyanobacteria bacterium]|nr:Uma2 family endonuclease [Cyanobacteriota bacterium]MDA0866091.1 Uma2 family endonuclease [Cyanobacteriota bacterium]